MFKSLKIKLLGAFALVSLFTVLVGVLSTHSLSSINDTLHYSVGNLAPSLDSVGQMRYEITRVLWRTARGASAALARETAVIAEARQGRAEALGDLERCVKDYDAIPLMQEEEAPWRKFKDDLVAWRTSN